MKENIEATVAIVDLRNFTQMYEMYQEKNDDTFSLFLKNYFSIGIHFTKVASFDKHYYVNTTGDGFIVVFYGKNHPLSGYLYGLLLYKALNKICEAFNRHQPENVSYGIGIESGTVQKVNAGNDEFSIKTFLGSVINHAARIEATTKMFHRTRLIIGNILYTNIVKHLYKEAFDNIVKDSHHLRKDYDSIISHHNEINVLNQKLMLFYIFEHNVKGVEDPLPLFRLSPTLASSEKDRYLTVIKKLAITENKYNEIYHEIKEYLI